MSPPDHDRDAYRPEPLDQLRHNVKGPLTTIRGRAQLLARAVHRSPSLTAAEREKLLRDLATIDAAVLAAVAILDGTHDAGDGEAPGTP